MADQELDRRPRRAGRGRGTGRGLVPRGDKNDELGRDRPVGYYRRRYPRYVDPARSRSTRANDDDDGRRRRESVVDDDGSKARTAADGRRREKRPSRRYPPGSHDEYPRRRIRVRFEDGGKPGTGVGRRGDRRSDGASAAAGGEQRPRRNRFPLDARARRRRSRLPRVFTREEYMQVVEAVVQLSKSLNDLKDPAEEDPLKEVADDAVKQLVKYFEESEIKNGYELALKMLMVAVGLDNAQALYPAILKALDLAIRGEDAKNVLTPELQGAAFVLSRVQELASCSDEVANLYELKGASGDKLKSLIGYLLKYHLYKQALVEVIENGMEAEFSVEEVVVPLVIQHAIAPVHEMLKKSPYYLEPLVRYLDKIVGFTLVEMTAEVKKYDIPYVIGLGRPFLIRVILGWQGEFKFDLALCPNIKMFFAKNHLYYLMRRRFRLNDLPYINWFELSVDLLAENPALADDLVDELVRYGQNTEAKYWAEHLKVDQNKLNQPVQEALDSVKDEFDIEEAKKTPLAPREGRTFYEMDMTDKTILFVEQDDDCARAFTAISNLVAEGGKVGIDVARKPDTAVLPNAVSVLSISTKEKCYIFDVKSYKNKEGLFDGLNKLLADENVVKIGFNIPRAIGFLERTLGVEFQLKEAKKVVDLRVLLDKFYRGHVDFLFPNASRKEFQRRNIFQVRLNAMVRAVFDGKSLNRAEVVSNWENRPLRSSQLQCAARDAWILHEIYDAVYAEAEKNGKDFEELLKPPQSRRRNDNSESSGGAESGGGEMRSIEEAIRLRYRSGIPARAARGGRGRFPPRGRGGAGAGGRFRGSGRRGYPERVLKTRPLAPNGERYPPATQKEEILEDGKVPEIMASPKKPKDFKIITDSMLRGLGKALKSQGFDVVVLPFRDRHETCVDHCKKEKRIILTQGRIFYDIKDQVSPGYCFKVVNKKVDAQFEEVCKAYHVELEEEAAGGDAGKTEEKEKKKEEGDGEVVEGKIIEV